MKKITFEEYLPVEAVRYAPGEYEIKGADGWRIALVEGAAVAEWLCERINRPDPSEAEDARCPVCGEPAEWRDIEGHPDGGEYYCPLGCEVPAR